MSDTPRPLFTLSSLPPELQQLIYQALFAEWLHHAQRGRPEPSKPYPSSNSTEYAAIEDWKRTLRRTFCKGGYAALALRATCRQFRDMVVPLTGSPHAVCYGCACVPQRYARFALGSMMLWGPSRRDRLTLDEHSGLYAILSATSCYAPLTDDDLNRVASAYDEWARGIVRCLDALFREEALAYTALDPDFWHDAAPGAGQTAVVEGGLLLRTAREVVRFVPSHRVSRTAAIERCKRAKKRTDTASHLLSYGLRSYYLLHHGYTPVRRVYLKDCFEDFAARVRRGVLRLPQPPSQEGGDAVLCDPSEAPGASTARNLLDILDKGLWRTSHLYC